MLSVDDDFAAGSRIHSTEDIENRTFPGSGGAADNHQLPLFNLKIDAGKGVNINFSNMIVFRYIAEFKIAHTGSVREYYIESGAKKRTI